MNFYVKTCFAHGYLSSWPQFVNRILTTVKQTCRILFFFFFSLSVLELIQQKAPNNPFIYLEVFWGLAGIIIKARVTPILGKTLVYPLSFLEFCDEGPVGCVKWKDHGKSVWCNSRVIRWRNRPTLWSGTPVRSFWLCSGKEIQMYTYPCVWSSSLGHYHPAERNQSLLSVWHPQAQLPTFLSALQYPVSLF